MAESTDQTTSVTEPDTWPPSDAPGDGDDGATSPPLPPIWLPPEATDAMMRYRRAAPWIIGTFGLMGAVVLLAVPLSALSDVEPTSRRTIVQASILALFGVAVAIIASARALAPRNSITKPIVPERHSILRYFSAQRSVEDAFARQADAEGALGITLLSDEMKQRQVRYERDRIAVRVGFAGVMVGALAIGTAMGIMVWEFENPTTVFEIDRIHADTIRIEAEAGLIVTETRRLEAEIARLNAETQLTEGELAVQAQKLELELQLLQDTIADTKANTARLEAEAAAAPTVEMLVAQLADVEIAIESIIEQLDDLQGDVARQTISG